MMSSFASKSLASCWTLLPLWMLLLVVESVVLLLLLLLLLRGEVERDDDDVDELRVLSVMVASQAS